MQQIVELIHRYGVLVVCASALLEDSGLPIPSYPVLMIAGALTLGGALAPLVLLAAVASAMVADAAWYLVGVRLGPRVLGFVCQLSLSPESCARRTERGFGRVGGWALVFAKFMPGLGLATIVLAGVSRLRLHRFLLFDAIGSTVYLGIAFGLGRLFHNAITALLAAFTRFGEIGAAAVAGIAVTFVLVRWTRTRRFVAQLRRNRISPAELAGILASGGHPLIIDVRPMERRIQEGMMPGALAIMPTDVSILRSEYPPAQQIILYGSSTNDLHVRLAARELGKMGFARIRPLEGGFEAWAAGGHPVEFAG